MSERWSFLTWYEYYRTFSHNAQLILIAPSLKQFSTQLSTQCFGRCSIGSPLLWQWRAINSAVSSEPSDYNKHYAVRKVNDTDHEYILTYTDTVSVCVSVVNGEVIKTTVNGSMVHGTDHYSLQELLKLLMHCKPCGKRLTANCIQLLSKYTKSVVCRPCQQVQSQRVRKEIQNAEKGMFHRLSYFQRRHTCYSIFSLTSDSHESMTTISGDRKSVV